MMKAKYEKLPKRFKTKWLKALRSGKYQRGYCELGQDGGCEPSVYFGLLALGFAAHIDDCSLYVGLFVYG